MKRILWIFVVLVFVFSMTVFAASNSLKESLAVDVSGLKADDGQALLQLSKAKITLPKRGNWVIFNLLSIKQKIIIVADFSKIILERLSAYTFLLNIPPAIIFLISQVVQEIKENRGIDFKRISHEP